MSTRNSIMTSQHCWEPTKLWGRTAYAGPAIQDRLRYYCVYNWMKVGWEIVDSHGNTYQFYPSKNSRRYSAITAIRMFEEDLLRQEKVRLEDVTGKLVGMLSAMDEDGWLKLNDKAEVKRLADLFWVPEEFVDNLIRKTFFDVFEVGAGTVGR